MFASATALGNAIPFGTHFHTNSWAWCSHSVASTNADLTPLLRVLISQRSLPLMHKVPEAKLFLGHGCGPSNALVPEGPAPPRTLL